MNGVIVKVDERQDGRLAPRAWIRPFSTMIGILYVYEQDGKLHITSSKTGEAGIYLAFKQNILRLPLNEHYTITAKNDTTLTAIHTMRIFGLSFLRIDFQIERR